MSEHIVKTENAINEPLWRVVGTALQDFRTSFEKACKKGTRQEALEAFLETFDLELDNIQSEILENQEKGKSNG